MGYKTITTCVRDPELDSGAVDFASGLADATGGHLHLLCLGIDRIEIGMHFEGASAATLQASLDSAREDAEAAAAAMRARMSGVTHDWDVSTVTVQSGAIGQVVARHAGLADLIVQGKPYGPGRGPEDVAVVEAALFGTRTSLLVVPEGATPSLAPKYIAVAWNESNEALAAIRGAMPMLKTAEQVDIVVVDPPVHGADRSDPGGALATVLARHGVKADVSVIAKTMPKLSDVLIRHCSEKGADMLVMGAYSHSRFREAILGGATRAMLENAELPVLMAH